MDLLSAAAEVARVWMEGGDWTKIQATEGFHVLVGVACWVAPTTIIALGLGVDSWRELPVAKFLGFGRNPDERVNGDANWAERARDLDKDGLADF
jgi:hypothetical protein